MRGYYHRYYHHSYHRSYHRYYHRYIFLLQWQLNIFDGMKISNIHSKHAGSTITFESILASILVTEGDAQCYHAVSVIVVHGGRHLPSTEALSPTSTKRAASTFIVVGCVFLRSGKKYLYSADMMLQIFQEFPNLIHWPVWKFTWWVFIYLAVRWCNINWRRLLHHRYKKKQIAD